jgi:hypothetical protein
MMLQCFNPLPVFVKAPAYGEIMRTLKLALASTVLAFSCMVLASPPQPPTNVTAIAGNGRVTVIWTAPSDDGGFPIKKYTARYDVKGPKCTVSAKKDRCTVAGVKNNRWNTFYVTATNKDGTSAPSQDSKVVIASVKNVDAQCGTANGLYYPETPPSPDDLCLIGGGWPAVKGEDGIYYWSCAGFREGKSVDCKSSGTVPLPTYKLGGVGPAGGKVFILSPDKQHGMEAADIKLTTRKWGCDGAYLGVTNSAIGAGASNTASILEKCPEKDTAAAMVAAFFMNGYDDWYLPSKEEFESYKYYIKNSEDPRHEFITSTERGANYVSVIHRAPVTCSNSSYVYCYASNYTSEDRSKSKYSCSGVDFYLTDCDYYHRDYWIIPVRNF